MKNNLRAKFNELTTLQGKDDFNVQDLIDVLVHLDPSAKLSFATIDERGCKVSDQKENLIFRLHQEDRDDEITESYEVIICTSLLQPLKYKTHVCS